MDIAGIRSDNAAYYKAGTNQNSKKYSEYKYETSSSINSYKTDNIRKTNALTSVGFRDNSNESFVEMIADSTYGNVNGYTTGAYGNFLSVAGKTSADITYDSSNINDKKDFKQMQYDTNNMGGNLSYKRVYDDMGDSDIKATYKMILEQHIEKVKEKFENGETEPSYQIGGRSFTENEWKDLIKKVDKDIEKIKEEQEERFERQLEEKLKRKEQEDTIIRKEKEEKSQDEALDETNLII